MVVFNSSGPNDLSLGMKGSFQRCGFVTLAHPFPRVYILSAVAQPRNLRTPSSISI